MPRTDDPTIHVPKPAAEFRDANPEVFAKAQGDPETTRRLAAIETRAASIRQRFIDHFERHEDAWVAAEALKMVGNRTYPTLQHPAPKGFDPPHRRGTDVAELMMTKARQNVHARGLWRLITINTIKNNLQNSLIRNRPQLSQTLSMPANDPARKQRIRNSNT